MDAEFVPARSPVTAEELPPTDLPSAEEDSVFAFCRSPQQFLLEVARARGPVARFRINHEPFAVLSDPDAIHMVLNGSAEDFEKGALADIPRIIFGDSVFTIEGDDWTRHHALLAQAFSKARMAALAPKVERAVWRLIERWKAGGADIDLLSAAKRLAYDLAGGELLGIEPGTLADELYDALDRMDRTEAVRLNYLRKRMPEVGGHFHPWRVSTRIDELIYAAVHARAARGGPGDDLIGMALASSQFADYKAEPKRKLVRDMAASMLVAGYITSGDAIYWTLYLLARHPEAQQRARAELRTSGIAGSTAEATPFVLAVLNESLRLYPPAWWIGRVARQGMRIGQEEIAAGTRLVTSPWVLHRMESVWPDAEEFRPERFWKTTPRPRTFLPFGSGVRACLGRALAMMELAAVVSGVLANFAVRVESAESPRLAATFSLRPREGMRFRLEPLE